MTEKERDRAIGVLEIIQKKCLEVKDIKEVSLYLKKMQDKCNLIHKFVKIEKVLLKIQIIFLLLIDIFKQCQGKFASATARSFNSKLY